MIEEVAAEDENNLQLGFDTYDSCSGKSTSLDFFILATLKRHLILSESQDECAAAASIYQCGRDKAPAITDSIYTTAAGNSTVVSARSIEINIKYF